MKSIKPGRGPSSMGAMGSVFAVLFGIFWTLTAVSSGAPVMFCMFGVLFCVMAAVQGVYHYRNATSKNRYSIVDITDDQEEVDPLQERFGEHDYTRDYSTAFDSDKVNYCPYCGTSLEDGFEYCPKCGKQLPK